MADETRDQKSQLAQTLFNKGFAAFERGNLDIAIDLLLRAVEISPGFGRARRFLRAAQIQKVRKAPPKSGLFGKLGELTTLPAYLKVTVLFKAGNLDKAFYEAEKLLVQDPLQRKSVYLYTEIAAAVGQMEAAILTLEAVAEFDPQDMEIARRLGDCYMSSKDFAKARDCFTHVLESCPTDAATLRKLKDAEANFAMVSGGMDESGQGKADLSKRLENKEQAQKLDIEAKAQVSGSDADIMISEYQAKIAAEPNNLNYYRALARTYLQLKRFTEAIAILEEARKINSSDPELDRSLTDARVREYNVRIEALRARNQTDAAAQLEDERSRFVFDDLVARVQRYPNDLRLRFELGVLYYQRESYDEAIQHLQSAQRSPKDRSDALFYLARSFRAKGQTDIALMQLETALSQLPIMDDNRKKVLFDMGEIYEQTGDIEKAFTCYREVYSADIGYLDIGAKMERLFKLRKQ